MCSTKVLATLTTDAGRILSKLHQVQPEGAINLLTGVRIAHVSLPRLFEILKKFLLFSSNEPVGPETPTRKESPHKNHSLPGITY